MLPVYRWVRRQWTWGGRSPRSTAAALWHIAAIACFAGILAAIGLGLTAAEIKGLTSGFAALRL